MNVSGKVSDKSGFFLLVFSISLAMFMSSLDGTIVNIALPTISEYFDVSTSSVSWVSTSYLLVMAGCLLIFGKISDAIGFKKVFITGFALFTAGSFACGFVPEVLNSFYSLVGSRAFQGVGGAMITAIAPAMIAALIPMEMKGKAMGIVMTFASLGMALGPTVGGFLTQYLSWNWIFYINVPVGIFAIILGRRVIPDMAAVGSLSGFDKYGASLIFAGLACLLFGFSEGGVFGWTSPMILLAFVLAVVLLGSFIRHELGQKDPLLELRLFKNRNFLFLNMLVILVFFAFAGVNYMMPFYLEYVLGYETSVAGLILTVLSFSMMVSGIISGLLYNRIGGRIICIVSAFVLAAGYFMMSNLHTDTTILFVGLCLFLVGFGIGLIITPAFNMIMICVSKKYQGMVSSLTSLERFAPMTIGIAVFNMIFVQGIIMTANHRGITETAPAYIKTEILSTGFDIVFFSAMIVGIFIIIFSFLVKEEIHPDYLESGGDEDEAIMAGI